MALALLAPRPNSHPFQERKLILKEPVKIGRAVAKAKSSQTNGIFDCKVLSRNHAVLWYENGKFMLQDTKSSNGTYVNNVRLSRGSEESDPCEIKSGDILQFGVEVVENSKNVTHGCIIGLITLFHEDGTEATGVQEDVPPGVLNLLTADKGIEPQELWQLSQFIQDALHREQTLENKLVTLQRMIANSHAASDDTFQGFIQEDKLLSRLETLENQLDIVSREISDDEARSELISYQDERLQYESAAKETLQKILNEKIEALQKCGELERLLSNTEDENTHLQSLYEKSQEELQVLMEKHRERLDEIQELKETLTSANERHETVYQTSVIERQQLKEQLDDAERRGSALAVEVESLQAECDFTKKQLQSMKERYEQLQEDSKHKQEETEDKDDAEKGSDLPFASDHATLEKDIKNKSAYIQRLKEQLAELQTELAKQRDRNSSLREQYEATELEEHTTVEDDNAVFENSKDMDLTEELKQVKQLQGSMMVIRDTLVAFANNNQKDTELNLQSVFWENFSNLNEKNEIIDPIDVFRQSLEESNELLTMFNSDIRYLDTALSKANDDPEVQEDLNETNESLREQLTSAQSEVEDVRKKILTLGERLLEEQEINKKNKELAASLEHQLFEAHKQMNIEKLDKSLSFKSLESARKVAEEMQKQASDYANIAGKEKVEIDVLVSENETLKMKVSRLESECKKLKHENSFMANASKLKESCSELFLENLEGSYENIEIDIVEQNANTSKSDTVLTRGTNRQLDNTSNDVSLDDSIASLNDMHKLKDERNTSRDLKQQLHNTSNDDVSLDDLIASLNYTQKLKDERNMINLLIAMFVILVAIGAMIMLDIIKVTPGSLPLLDERTWTEVWEHLF